MFRPTFLTQVSSVAVDLPDWLNEKELQQIIKNEFQTFQQIENIQCRSQLNTQRLQIQIKLAGEHTPTSH